MKKRRIFGVCLIIVAVGILLSSFEVLPFTLTDGGCKEFKTNAIVPDSTGQGLNYASTGIWISLDLDEDGVLEGFIYKDSRISPNALQCDSPTHVSDSLKKTSEGYRILNKTDENWLILEGPSYYSDGFKRRCFNFYSSSNPEIDLTCSSNIENPPEEEIICDRGDYDPLLDKCIYKPQIIETPEIIIVCNDGIYDEGLEKCIVSPEVEVECEKGLYNSMNNYCEYYAETEILCIEGEYDPASNTCKIFPDISTSCLLGDYDSGLDKCILFPSSEINCIEGEYDIEKEACIIFPEVETICERGIYDEDKDVCVISFSNRVNLKRVSVGFLILVFGLILAKPNRKVYK